MKKSFKVADLIKFTHAGSDDRNIRNTKTNFHTIIAKLKAWNFNLYSQLCNRNSLKQLIISFLGTNTTSHAFICNLIHTYKKEVISSCQNPIQILG